MDANDMGKLIAHLLKWRYVESAPSEYRGRRYDDDVVSILKECEPDEMDLLKGVLKGMGFQLLEYGDTEYKGIAPGGRLWLIARDANVEPPDFLGKEYLHRKMFIKSTDTKQKTGIWFLHIWMMYLKLLYTDPGRSPSEVSRYQEVPFDKEQLVSTVNAHIEQIRKTGVDGGVDEAVFHVLDSAKSGEVSKRVQRFLDLMHKANLLEKHKDGAYQQSLLGAVEFARGYERTLHHYFSMDDDPQGKIASIVNIATDLSISERKNLDESISVSPAPGDAQGAAAEEEHRVAD